MAELINIKYYGKNSSIDIGQMAHTAPRKKRM